MTHHIATEAARAALARAAWVRGNAPAYDEAAISHLLADIRHLCAAAGLDFARCEHVSRMFVQMETGGAS